MAKWSTSVKLMLSEARAVSNEMVAVRSVVLVTVRVVSRFNMYPGGIVFEVRLPIVNTYSEGLVPMVCVVLTVPMLVFAPHGATENNVADTVAPDRVMEAEIHRWVAAGDVRVRLPASAGSE
jgi:hypothetical protein